jgi:hypothetical protein
VTPTWADLLSIVTGPVARPEEAFQEAIHVAPNPEKMGAAGSNPTGTPLRILQPFGRPHADDSGGVC